MYLQPIFDSPDIVRQLPSENKKFKGVDKIWKNCINECVKDPNVLAACAQEKGLLEQFQQSNRNLEIVQRGLICSVGRTNPNIRQNLSSQLLRVPYFKLY